MNKFLFVVAFAIACLSSSASFAQSLRQSDQCDIPSDRALVLGAELTEESVAEATENIWRDEPDAKVFVPEGDVAEIAGVHGTTLPADIAAPAAAPALPRTQAIAPQSADSLNTVVLLIEYGCMNTIYLVSHNYSWLEATSLIAFNLAYLHTMDLKLGRWTMLMQKGGRLIKNTLKKLNIISQEKWEHRADLAGSFITHGFMSYAFYLSMQVLARLPNLHDGMLSAAAQMNVLRTTGIALFSGVGWTMLARKWDARKEADRPIGRQPYYAFNNMRATVMGLLIPILISTDNGASFADFLQRNFAFLVSGVAGATAFAFADPIMARVPRIAKLAEKFQRLTERLNVTCARILERTRILSN